MTAIDVEPKRLPVGSLDRAIHQAFDRWLRFWFTPADPAPLGVLRVLFGGMLVYSHLVWGIDLEGFLGHDGWNSAEVVRELQRGQPTFSFWWSVPDEWMLTVHHWSIAMLTLFWLGICTRITSILAFIIHVSYCQRASLSTFGLDQICVVMIFYLMIGPSGATYSIDRLLRRGWRYFRHRRQPTTAILVTDIRSSAARLSLRLIQVHYCIIYFFAGTAKLQGESWWDGSAMWRAISNYEYQSLDITWLARFPEFLQLVTHIAILWEISFAYLVWVTPTKPLVLSIGVLVHLGIGAFLGMWTFGLAMIFGYIAFLEPEFVRSAVALPKSLFLRLRTRPTA